ncbi:unnamed protein product, partial [Rotaria sordida]
GSLFTQKYKHQISHLNIMINDDNTALRVKNVATNIFTNILMIVRNFNDCLCLLDGCLNQLHTFIVKIDNIDDLSMTIQKKRTLSNLRCFSLISTDQTDKYDIGIVPFLHQMSQLEKLTLSLIVLNRISFIDGTNYTIITNF